MNELDEMIKQATEGVEQQEASLASAEARVAVAQADAAAAREKLSEARIVLDWLRRRSQSQPGEASPQDPAERPQPPLRMVFGKPVQEGDTKLKKLLDALEKLGGTASNKQLGDRMDMSPDHVRGLLKYASSKQHPPVVTDPGSGVWRLTRSLNGAGGRG